MENEKPFPNALSKSDVVGSGWMITCGGASCLPWFKPIWFDVLIVPFVMDVPCCELACGLSWSRSWSRCFSSRILSSFYCDKKWEKWRIKKEIGIEMWLESWRWEFECVFGVNRNVTSRKWSENDFKVFYRKVNWVENWVEKKIKFIQESFKIQEKLK